ncbi:MAG TPA: OB-fold domain-containing protein [Thermomicrobiaceae bacterium]|nr:OB-fold domain-containing protein [Thermomicrobiaceae bacterium]
MSGATTQVAKAGTVVTYTIIYVPIPEFAGTAPYGLAVIETDDDERGLVRVEVDADGPGSKLAVGSRVVYDHDDDHGPIYRLG